MSNTVASTTKKLVGYFPAGASKFSYAVGDIPVDQLTHVIYAFANVTPAGDCVSINAKDDQTNFPELADLKASRPELRVLISVGGASHSANFSLVASTAATREHFAKSCVQFISQNNFDGVDIDWEFPGAADSKNFTSLLQELRNQLRLLGSADQRSYLLTMAAPAGVSKIANLELSLIHPLLDWINLETYDFHTVSNLTTNFDAPLFTISGSLSVDAAVKAYLAAGVPADKLVLGVRFVGTGWQGVGPANNGLNQTASGPAPGTWDTTGAPSGSFGFQDIENNYLPDYTRSWDKEAQVPWLYSPDTGIMISYEDAESLTAKANYAVSKDLIGVMIWQLAADDEQDTLVKSLAKVLA